MEKRKGVFSFYNQTRRQVVAMGLVILLLIGTTPQALWANPIGEAIKAGNATFTRDGNNLIIKQGSDRMVVNWQSFSVGKGELTKFIQPGAKSSALNRVLGGTRSLIDGRLEANGQVILVNPAGITVGPTGVINVNSFVGSTLDITDENFMAGGDLKFSGDSEADITNLGTIKAETGDVFLLAKTIDNQGTIEAPNGTVGLGAGSEIVIQPDAAEKLYIAPSSKKGGTITSKGAIRAAAAEIKAAGNPYALAINLDGVVEVKGAGGKPAGTVKINGGAGNVKIAKTATIKARNADNSGGMIAINGKADDSKPKFDELGDVEIAGTLDAAGETGAGGKIFAFGRTLTATNTAWFKAGGPAAGGFIETSGADVKVAGSISAGKGGKWLLDPTNVTIDDAMATSIAAALEAGTDSDIQADNDITVAANITAGGAGNLFLRADYDASGAGTVVFDSGKSITRSVGSTGNVSIFYNPTSYSTPTDYSSNVAVSAGAFRAYMLVNSASDLQNVNSNLTGTYALNKDIDASGLAFTPIGSGAVFSEATIFKGIFDGQGHKIDNLQISLSLTAGGGAKQLGLFGAIGGDALIDNVHLTNAAINAGGALDFRSSLVVGGLVGNMFAGTIQNSTFEGAISVDGLTAANSSTLSVGGLVGSVTTGKVSKSSAKGSVSVSATSVSNAQTYIGGFYGRAQGGSHEQVFTTMSVTAAISGTGTGSFGYAGGFAGFLSNANVSYAYSSIGKISGSINGVSTVAGGGFAGTLGGGSLRQVYASGPNELSSSGMAKFGGVMGSAQGSITLESVYWDKESTTQFNSPMGTGLSTAEMKGQSAAPYNGLLPGFSSGIWGLSSAVNDGYPTFKTNIPIVPVTVSGKVIGLTGGNVSIAINGTVIGSPVSLDAMGEFTFDLNSSNAIGDAVVWVNGGSANGYMTLTGKTTTGFDLETNWVWVHDSQTTSTLSTAIANLGKAQGSLTDGMLYSVDEGSLAVNDGFNFRLDTTSSSLTINSTPTISGSIEYLATAKADANIVVDSAITRAKQSVVKDTSTVLRANNNILFNAGSSLSVADEADGKMNIVLNSNRDSAGTGNIVLEGSDLDSNGGDIILGGGEDPSKTAAKGYVPSTPSNVSAASGIYLAGTNLLAKGGNVSIRGEGAAGGASSAQQFGVRLTEFAAGGTGGTGGAGGAGGAASRTLTETLTTSVSSTGSGTVSIYGNSGGGEATGMGVWVNRSTVQTEAGKLTIEGVGNPTSKSESTGLRIDETSLVQTDSGDISLKGEAHGTNPSAGVVIRSYEASRTVMVTSATGKIEITGSGSPESKLQGAYGVSLINAIVETTGATGGNVVIEGRGGSDNARIQDNAGVSMDGSTVSTKAGGISLTGENGSYRDLSLTGSSKLVSETGNILVESKSATGELQAMYFESNNGSIETGGDVVLKVKGGVVKLFGNQSNIKAKGLELKGPGSFDVYAANDVDTIAVSDARSVNFLDIDDLHVGTVNGTDGIKSGIVNIRTSNDITVDKQISTTGAGVSLVLVSTGYFYNNAGATALSTVEGGNWQVWSLSYSRGNPGGLVPNYKQYGAQYGATTPEGTGNGFLYYAPYSIYADLVGTVSKEYDGTEFVKIDGDNIGFAGLIAGQKATTTGGTGDFSDPNAGENKAIEITSANVTLTEGDINLYGYKVVYRGGLGTITPKKLTATTTQPVTKDYDGKLDAEVNLADVMLEGLVGAQTITVDSIGTAFYNNANVLEARRVSATLSGYTAGEGTMLSNYDLPTLLDAKGQIIPRTITVNSKGTELSKTYDGMRDIAVTEGYFKVGNTVEGQSISIGSVMGEMNSPDVVTTDRFLAMVLEKDFIAGANTELSNYDLGRFVFDGAARVMPKDLTAVVSGVVEKIYDGNTHVRAAEGQIQLEGLVGEQRIDVRHAMGDYNSANVAEAVTVAFKFMEGDFVPEGDTMLSNYVLPKSTTGEGKITAKDITVFANSGRSIYGESPENPGFQAEGLVDGQTEVVLTGLYNDFAITKTTNADMYSLNVIGTLTNENYNVFKSREGSWTVTPKGVVVTADSGTSVYGESPAAPGYTAEGLVNDQTKEVLTGLAGAFKVDNYSPVRNGYETWVDGELTNGNYFVWERKSGTWDVTPAPLTITADNQTKVYGTEFEFNGTEYTAAGLVNGETAGLLKMGSKGAPGFASVGAYEILIKHLKGDMEPLGMIEKKGGFNPSNYDITYVDGKFTVTPAPISVRANGGQSQQGQSPANPGVTLVSGSLFNGDTLASLHLLNSFGINGGTAAGRYLLKVLGESGNYAITTINGEWTVAALPTAPTDTAEKIKGEQLSQPPPESMDLPPLTFIAGSSFTGGLETQGPVDVEVEGFDKMFASMGLDPTEGTEQVSGWSTQLDPNKEKEE